MPSRQIQVARLRFLPAALVPRQLRCKIEPAIDDLIGQLGASPGLPELEQARESLLLVKGELGRHLGRCEESSIVTKEAVFLMSEQLDLASRLLARAKWPAASLVAAAIDDRLLALVAELQPVAPA